MKYFMRTSNSIKNSLTSFVGSTISCLIAFVSQAIFIKILGVEYIGVNGLFSNILSMFSIFELGIGSAIVYYLYKPIGENDEKKIKELLNFYNKAYKLICAIIFICGVLLIPFLKYIIKDLTLDINIYLVYFLFLLSTLTSYCLAYKRSFIIANQKNYIINLIHMFYLVFLNISQLIVIYFTRNYYLYLIIKVLSQILECIIISIYFDKNYNKYQVDNVHVLDKKTENAIFNKVKALLCHKIGAILVMGTDNIIISSFFGVIKVGLYSNYNTIISAVSTIFTQIISTTTASIGNLLIYENNEKKYEVFSKIRFLNLWISIFTSICILLIIQPFIALWIGSKYELSIEIVFMLVLNFFQNMQRQTYSTFKDSAGIWTEDKVVPLIESFLNIFFSIVCLKLFGLLGVFIGTFISGLILWCYSYPKFVYKKLFNRSYKSYIKETMGSLVLLVALALLTYNISIFIPIRDIWVRIVVNIFIAIVVPNLILIFLFRNTREFKYYLHLLKDIKNKLKKN